MASKHGEKEMIPICFNNINGRVTFHQDVHASLAGSDPKNALLRFSLVLCSVQTPSLHILFKISSFDVTIPVKTLAALVAMSVLVTGPSLFFGRVFS